MLAASLTQGAAMFANVTIRTRLALLLAFVNVLLLAAAFYGWYAISRLNGQLESTITLQNQVEVASDLARRAQLDFKIQVQEWKNVLIRGNDAQLYEKHWKSFVAHSAKVRTHLTSLGVAARKIGLSEQIAEKALAEHEELDKRYHAAIKSFHPEDLASSDQVDKLVRGMDRAATDNIDVLVKAIHEQGDKLAEGTSTAAASEKTALVAGLTALALFAIIVSVVAGTMTVLAITRRLSRATEVARAVAGGDLSADIEVGRNDELGQLLGSLRAMNDSLGGIVARVRHASEQVATASTQIAAGNTDLASRTEEQASSLEETAASIEELTAAVNQNAQNASQANSVAVSASEVAQRGGIAVDQMVKMMENIQGSSRKIGDIIGVIDSIAFQTNILALNAAVEAARAGEQGRGFAVVAGEVRSLAQKSAEAAKEIKRLITDSSERIDEGARVAGGAGETMKEVVVNVNRVSQIISEITAATTEQSVGISQVNRAVTELDQVTQKNASLVEESTSASESLKDLAGEMSQAVSVFRIDERILRQYASRAPAPALQRPAQPARLGTPATHTSLPAATAKAAQRKALANAAAGAKTETWEEF
jgi:methyl-accepting chemotaxis protein-1 (serine sensor receptor)